MKLKRLQLLQISLLLIALINNLMVQVPYVTTVCIIIAMAIVFYDITFYDITSSNEVFHQTVKYKESTTNCDINLVTHELIHNIKYEIDTINTELNRTNEIVKSAMVGISASFKQLNELNDKQKNILDTLIYHSTHLATDQTLAGCLNSLTDQLSSICCQLEDIENAEQHSVVQKSDTAIEQAVNQNTNISVFTENINQMIEFISQLNSIAEQSSNAQSHISHQLNEAVSTGIVALQFEDLTYQTLTSIKQNTQTLTELTNYIPVLLTLITQNDPTKLMLLKQKLVDIKSHSQLRNNTKSVEQCSMEEGDIEFF